MKRWIFFDAVGTLFTIRGSVGGQYARAAGRFGAVNPDPEKIRRAFQDLFPLAAPLAFPQARSGNRTLEFNWWKDLVRRVTERAAVSVNFDEYFKYLYKTFATAVCWDLYPETLATLKLLRQQRYGVGVISNFDSRLMPLLEEIGLHRWITTVTISSTAGSAKPDPRIFLKACAQARVAPESSWHVGNSPVEDYQGAHKAGLKAILLDRGDRYGAFSGPKVKRLSQVVALLEQT